jgi:hypothetical protein
MVLLEITNKPSACISARVARWCISNPKSHFESILEGLRMENVGIFYIQSFGIFYGDLENLKVIW